MATVHYAHVSAVQLARGLTARERQLLISIADAGPHGVHTEDLSAADKNHVFYFVAAGAAALQLVRYSSSVDQESAFPLIVITEKGHRVLQNVPGY